MMILNYINILAKNMLIIFIGTSLAAFQASSIESYNNPRIGNSFQVSIKSLPISERYPTTFEKVKGLIIFKSFINGKEVNALFDNRAEHSLVSERIVESENIVSSTIRGKSVSAAGEADRKIAKISNVIIPGQMIIDSTFVVLDLSKVSHNVGRNIDLVIGNEIFQQLTIIISFKNSKFSFAASGAANPPFPYKKIAMLDRRPRIDVMIDGRKYIMTVDLGFNGTAAISSEKWDEIVGKKNTYTGLSVDIFGNSSNITTKYVDSVAIEGIYAEIPTVCNCPVLNSDGDGLVGTGILMNSDLIIDIKRQSMWIRSK